MKRIPRTPAHPRGSVLIFALVLLTLLFAMGAALIFFVTQQSRAGANALRNSGGDTLVDSAEHHAMQAIRGSVRFYEAVSPDGIYFPGPSADTDPNHAFLISKTDPILSQPQRSIFRAFESFPTHQTVAPTVSAVAGDWKDGHAWLFWNDASAYCGAQALETNAGTPLRFSESTLAYSAYPNGALRQSFVGGPEHAGLARAWLVSAAANDFYLAALPAVKPTRPNDLRGEYYIWVADLDGKLYAVPKDWGLDTNFFAGHATLDGVETDETAALAVLNLVNDYGPAASWAGSYGGLKLTTGIGGELEKLRLAPAGTAYASYGDLALYLSLAVPASGSGAAVWDYYHKRYGLERYLTLYRDLDTGLTPPTLKSGATELNINTAPFEVLAAALSRVPMVDAYVPTDVAVGGKVEQNVAKASALAARIVAKRPFLCRMDFEDFLAAQLTGDLADAATPLGMIAAAFPKRQELAAPAEASYLDLDDVEPYKSNPAQLILDNPIYADVHTKLRMQARFAFFAEPNAATGYDRAFAVLTPAAFNNLLNATSGKRRDGTYGYSYYSFRDVSVPFRYTVGPDTFIPKFEYNLITDVDIGGGINTYRINGVDPLVHTEAAELAAWHATNGSGYYEMHFGSHDDDQVYAYGSAVPPPAFPATEVLIVGPGLNGTVETPDATTEGDGDDVPGTTMTGIVDGPDLICNSTVHGPIRGYRISFDVPVATPVPTRTSGPDGNGDVAWAPRFGFRSRFFAVYTLARPIIDVQGNVPTYGAAQRSEIVYDALRDTVLFRREPATEKRTLGDPTP